MKGTLLILSALILGGFTGYFYQDISLLDIDSINQWILYALLFVVGISIGSDKEFITKVKTLSPLYFLLPIITITGTLIGAFLFTPLTTGISYSESLAVGAGFGYYSLSSVIITQIKGAELGIIALMANIIREVVVLIFAPLLVKYFSQITPICCAGATSMDSTLPVITKYSGSEFVIIAIMHGVIVDASVPLLVTFFCTIN